MFATSLVRLLLWVGMGSLLIGAVVRVIEVYG